MGITSLRLMFMNAENLFSPGKKFYGSQYSQAQYDAKVEWIGTKVAEHQVHACAFSEIGENANSCIQDIIQIANTKDKTGWPSFAHHFVAQPSKRGTKIRLGIISRFGLSCTDSLVKYPDGFSVDLHKPGTDEDANEWIVVPSEEFSRPVCKVKINPPNDAHPFNVFVVHLKSKRASLVDHDGKNEAIGIARAAIQRNVEAAALRYYFDAFLPKQYKDNNNVPTIVIGDFNDTPSSVPLENIRGPFEKVPGPSSPWSGPDKRRLLSCARLHLKKDSYEDKLFSYIHNENFSLIDQALVTSHLAGKFTRMEVYNDHVLRHESMSTSTAQAQQWKSMVSDHGVIVLEFTRMLKS